MLLAVLIIFLIIGSLTKKALIKIIDMGKDAGMNADTVANTTTDEDNENKENDMSNS